MPGPVGLVADPAVGGAAGEVVGPDEAGALHPEQDAEAVGLQAAVVLQLMHKEQQQVATDEPRGGGQFGSFFIIIIRILSF